MAKFGEGDPRWLVEDRKDGTNVNNWHWSEKDCLEWSRQRLSELFVDLVLLPAGPASIVVSGPPEVTGEAFVNIRKAKMVPSYELAIALPWKGEVRDGEGAVVGACRGKVHLPYVADENHDEDPELRIAAETDDAAASRLKEAFNAAGRKVVYERIAKFVKELRAGGPMGAAAAAAATAPPSSSPLPEPAAPAAKLPTPRPEGVRPPAPVAAAKGRTSSIAIKERFFARTADILECFTSPQRIMAYTQSPASLDARPGGAFSMFGGSVSGVFVELTATRLVQKWRFNNWEEGCFSQVTIDLSEPEPGNTTLVLSHVDIPEADRFGNEDVRENVDKGWRSQILARIRSVFGYGA